MARSSRSARRPRAGKRRGRDRVILYILLVLIAGLLGVIVTLLPRERPEPGYASESATGPEQESAEEPQPEGEEPTAETSPEAEPGVEPRVEVTETYPEDEAVESAGEPGDRAGELWWLPDAADPDATRGVLYLILDDAGNSLEPLPTFLEFPGPLAVAVLPNLPYSVESAARTAAAGQEIMLHQPMEAVGGADPGPGALTVDLADSEVLRVIDDNLASVPGVIGVNNHMGSRATADERIMELVLADISRRGLFFVDSRTTVDSVAAGIAGNLQTPFAARHVFLDNDRSRDAILAAIRGALELTYRQDAVVMIGHATVPELAEVLNEVYPLLIENGYRFGRISEIVSAPRLAEGLD